MTKPLALRDDRRKVIEDVERTMYLSNWMNIRYNVLPKTISFSVEVPFPTTLVIASIASVAVVGVGLLVHFKKHKH